MPCLPEPFIERLKHIIPEAYFENVRASFERPKPIFVRVNTIKYSVERFLERLRGENTDHRALAWLPAAFELKSQG